MNLQLTPTDSFPALEYLALDTEQQVYQLTLEYCRNWTTCMSWAKLHTLDLGDGSPTNLLVALTGKVQQSKDLTFGFCYCDGAVPLWKCVEMGVVAEFLAAIDGLNRVRIVSYKDVKMAQIREGLWENHGKSLRHICADMRIRETWSNDDFYAMANRVRGLRSLTATVDLRRVEASSGSVLPVQQDMQSNQLHAVWVMQPENEFPRFSRLKRLLGRPTLAKAKNLTRNDAQSFQKSTGPLSRAKAVSQTHDLHTILASLTSLQHLTLLVPLYYDSYELFSNSTLKREEAKTVALRLWNDLAAIQHMELAFHAPSPSTKVWTYVVARKWNTARQSCEVTVKVHGFEADDGSFDPFA